MKRRLVMTIVIAALAAATVHADMRFSIRYQDKNIHYPGDEIPLKLTLSNTEEPGADDLVFYLADDPRQSFGFDLRSLAGEPAPMADGLASALSRKGAYRVVHLSPGQELSITVALNDWADLSNPGQYRLTGFFYPQLRDQSARASRSDSVLDLSVLPDSDRRWEDELDQEIREALTARDLDPWGTVRETLDGRRESRFNRAILYIDTESMSRILPGMGDSGALERSLREGSWKDVPGFEHPSIDYELKSSRVFPNEATVRVVAAYEPHGERFERDLRFYLHKPDGYWVVRRVEALAPGDADPEYYGALDLDPPEVVNEMLQAVQRGDWEVALRYLDTGDMVRSLPEYADRWNDMSATEHDRAREDYRNRLITGRLDDARKPLMDIETWTITRVSYSETVGTVTVENTKTHQTAAGPLNQDSVYTFRLARETGDSDRWQVMRYDTAIVR